MWFINFKAKCRYFLKMTWQHHLFRISGLRLFVCETCFIASSTHFTKLSCRNINLLCFNSSFFFHCLPSIFFKSLETWFAVGQVFGVVRNFEANYVVQPQAPTGFYDHGILDNFSPRNVNALIFLFFATRKPDKKNILSHLCHVKHMHTQQLHS